jgi:LysM repeat protein
VVIVAILSALMTQVVLGGQGNTGTWVTVQRGQSLWGIAASHYTQTDPRDAIVEIQDANHLQDDLVYPGQRLLLPDD